MTQNPLKSFLSKTLQKKVARHNEMEEVRMEGGKNTLTINQNQL